MEAAERTISQILTEQIRYEIPAYQRPYSWEKGNVEQLLDDIWEAYEAQDEEYFIGSLITIEREKGRLYDVVDGQQRLTTLNLILARLRDHIEDPEVRADLGKRVLPKNPYTGEEETPRLTLRQRDQSFFRRHVLAGQAIPDAIRKEIVKDQDAPKQRIVENLEAIDAFIGQHDQRMKLFANFLLSKVYVVFVTTASWQSAYRLFNVLNARGMALSNADLIKNMLFARLGGNSTRSGELDEAWLELEEQIGIERLDQFMAHHRSSIVATKARRALHEEFEPLVEAAVSPFSLLGELNTSARNYLRILRNDFETPAARRAVRSLQRVAFEEWIPPLLAFLNRPEPALIANENPAPALTEDEFIDLLERITYQNWIRRLAFTARLTVYFQLITAIRAGKSADDIRAIFLSNANDDEFRSLIDGEVYGRPFAQAVLLRLEEADQDESVTKDFGGKITIEHVLPQALKDDYWRERFTDDDHRLWLHRLGNLALLAGIKNYKAKFYSFDRKKEVFSRKNDKVSFDTTKPILAADEWTKDQLASRQIDLVGRAVRVWSLASPAASATTGQPLVAESA